MQSAATTLSRGATSRRLLGLAGPAALVGAGVAFGIRYARRQDWLDEVVAGRCRNLPALPDVTVLGRLGVGCCAIAAVSFTLHARRLSRDHDRRTRPVVAIGALGAVVAATTMAVGALFVATTPTSPYDGLDGSGLPCPSGMILIPAVR